MVLQLVVAVVAAMFCAACGADRPNAEPASPVGPKIPVGEKGTSIVGLSVGEGAVWAAIAGFESLVARIDPERDVITAAIPLEGGVGDVAAGAGAVWAAGQICIGPLPEDPDVCLTAPRVWRIDPASNEVVTTIPIEPPAGVREASPFAWAIAVGEGAVWLSVTWRSSAGEIIRIDPNRNEVVARIPTDGHIGELRIGGGAIWAIGRSILRIDPRANRVAAMLVRGEVDSLGGHNTPAWMAAGERTVWVAFPTVEHFGTALKIDIATNVVARVRLPLERFYPVAVLADGVWFVGHDGRNRGLGRLNAETLEVEEWIDPGVDVVRATYDNATETFWFGSQVIRYDQQGYVTHISR